MRKLRPRARLRIHATRTRGKRSFLRSFFRSFVRLLRAALHFISSPQRQQGYPQQQDGQQQLQQQQQLAVPSTRRHQTVQRAAQLSHSKSWQQLSRGASSRRRRRRQLLGRARRLTTALRATQQSKTKQNKQQEAKKRSIRLECCMARVALRCELSRCLLCLPAFFIHKKMPQRCQIVGRNEWNWNNCAELCQQCKAFQSEVSRTK